MNLNLKNPLVFFDLETTGTNITTDRIIELAYVKVFPNGKTEEKDIYINPGMPFLRLRRPFTILRTKWWPISRCSKMWRGILRRCSKEPILPDLTPIVLMFLYL